MLDSCMPDYNLCRWGPELLKEGVTVLTQQCIRPRPCPSDYTPLYLELKITPAAGGVLRRMRGRMLGWMRQVSGMQQASGRRSWGLKSCRWVSGAPGSSSQSDIACSGRSHFTPISHSQIALIN